MDINTINQNIQTSREMIREVFMELNENQKERISFVLKSLNDKIKFLEPKYLELLEVEREIENLEKITQSKDIVHSMVERFGLKATSETIINKLKNK